MKRATTDDNFDNYYRVISIHALVKRATGITSVNPVTVVISIHALVKRATPFHLCKIAKYTYFNPRPREEGDN